MPTITQAGRFLVLSTPLDPDTLLIRSISGKESISDLFEYQVEAQTPTGTLVPYDRLLGQRITVQIDLGTSQPRYISGICNRLAETGADHDFDYYRLDVVPSLWFLTRRVQSRIFQQMTVPDILKAVLTGIDVEDQIQGSFQPRDYCVQYRESDFAFASRLMEEEGIAYYFRHAPTGHKLILGNTNQAFAALPDGGAVTFSAEGHTGQRRDDQITQWQKIQEVRSGKVTLWDHSFELPHRHLEAEKAIQESVQIGATTHKLKIGVNERLELYDYPGAYAQRFDGIDPAGGEQPGELQKIFEDNARAAALRMQEEAARGVTIRGEGHARALTPGSTFELDGHPNANGSYLLTAVSFEALQDLDYRTRQATGREFRNQFTCMPLTLPFRPERKTPRPTIHGTQTAIVVGPAGEEIFTDKYSRVKAQFHWDREGKNDGGSSCWIRVATPWAGTNWGMIHIPRVGQEVIVAFEEGDPDRPIIVGSVYNAREMPPYGLPANKTQSGIKSRSTLKGTPQNFNEIRFEDKKDAEEIYIHAEKDLNTIVENNETRKVGFDKKDAGNQTIEVYNNQSLTVGKAGCADGSQTITIHKDRTETVKTGNEKVTIEQGDRTHALNMGNDALNIKMGNRDVKIDMGNDALTIKMGNQTTKLNLGKSSTEAMQSIELKVGQSSIKVDQMGVTIKGMMVKIEGTVMTEVKGLMTQVNGSAMLTCKGGLTMIN